MILEMTVADEFELVVNNNRVKQPLNSKIVDSAATIPAPSTFFKFIELSLIFECSTSGPWRVQTRSESWSKSASMWRLAGVRHGWRGTRCVVSAYTQSSSGVHMHHSRSSVWCGKSPRPICRDTWISIHWDYHHQCGYGDGQLIDSVVEVDRHINPDVDGKSYLQ
jgi:hypothetical protein